MFVTPGLYRDADKTEMALTNRSDCDQLAARNDLPKQALVSPETSTKQEVAQDE